MVGAWDQNMWDDITFGNLATAAPSILTAWDQNFWDDITFGNLATAAADILSAWDQDSPMMLPSPWLELGTRTCGMISLSVT
jgi:hypothetical protein